MKIYLHRRISITLAICLGLALTCTKATALDVNLNGNANLNVNPINNNKYSTQMTNFAPGNIPLQQVDLTPLATPPPTSEIKSFYGGKPFIDVVDKDVKNEKEAKELQRKTGQLLGKAPEILADDEEVKDSDIQDFLASYYKYLRSEGLSSGSLPFVPINNSPAKSKSSIKQKNNSAKMTPQATKELSAKEQKLLITNTPSLIKNQNPNSP